MPYTGDGKLTYWATLSFTGTAFPGMVSEKIPVVVDTVTTYSFQVTAEQVWNSGYRIQLKFYDSSDVQTGGSALVSSGALTAGNPVTTVTVPMTAPANSSYCQPLIEYIGSPPASAPLQVYEARVLTGANTAQPTVVNANYAFVHSTDPWTAYDDGILDWQFDPLSATDGDEDSLVIDDLIELMGGAPGIQSSIPELTDPVTGRAAIFRIPAPGGTVGLGGAGPYDLGAPQPTSDIIESLLLDGERPFGSRSSNRTIVIPVAIFAPTLRTLAAAREILLNTIDQQTWKLTWRPASSGLPQEYDCFRANPSVVTYGFNYNREGNGANSANPATWALSVVTISFPALPYARSGQDGTQVLAFEDGTLDGGLVHPEVEFDDYSTVNSAGEGGTWKQNTAYVINSSQSARWSAAVPMTYPWKGATYTKTGLSLDITGRKTMAVWMGMSYDTQWPTDKKFKPRVVVAWTLSDANGKKLSFSETQPYLPWGADPNKPLWTRVGVSIPQGKPKTTFDYSRVTGYAVRITNWAGAGKTGLVRMHAWLSDARAIEGTSKWLSTPHGSVYSVFGLPGIARSPLTAEVQLPAESDYTRELTKTGTWTVPRGVTSLSLAEAWGGGGGGGSVTGVAGGHYAGGGGAGEYSAEAGVSVIPGTAIPFTIGPGGSGGQVVSRTATFSKTGANAWTAPGGVSVVNADLWGGGAAGAAGGAGGGAGAFTRGTLNVTPGTTYTFTLGAGGKPNWSTLSKDQATRHGGDTVARGDGYALHAHGGSSPVTGGTNGGAGGTGFSGTGVTSASAGGKGGNSPGGAGGGGAGAGGFTVNGNDGGSSPKGANNYGTGGTGGTGLGGGGNGGNGANTGGVPGQGKIPGGGGGGGYTRAVNNNGAYGANGKIVISWQENLGNPVNGASTVFGQAGLTSKVVTAHGGGSPALNSPDGGAPGTGSANTVHFDGGEGGMSGNFSDYLYRVDGGGGAGWARLAASSAASTAAYVSAAAASGLTTGLAVATVISDNALNGNVSVHDDAGNSYDLAASSQVPSDRHVSLFTARLGAPITTSTTLHVDNGGVADNFTVNWHGSPQFSDADAVNAVASTGTSAAPAGVVNNPDLGTHKAMFTVMVNDSSATVFALPAGWSRLTADGATSSDFASGTTRVSIWSKDVSGSAAALTPAGTLSGSAPWATVTLPVVPQDTMSPLPLKIGSASGTGTTSAVGFAASGYPDIPAGTPGSMLLLCHFAGTPGTVTVADTPVNTWTQKGTVTVGSSVYRAYTAAVTNGYSTTATVTLTDSTSQAHNSALYFVPNGTYDATGFATNTGSSAAPAVSRQATTLDNPLDLVIYVNNNTVDPTAGPAGFVNWGTNSNGAQHSALYAARRHGKAGGATTGTFAASQAWGAMALTFSTLVHSGSGGASGGPLGRGSDGSDNAGPAWSDGGKGADGLLSALGPGNNAAIPGGGGSGAGTQDASAQVGGSGGDGMVRITWTPPLRTFNDMILHRPGDGSKQTLSPVVSIPPNDPPDNREYPVPSLISGRNAEFWGTYTVLLVANSWNPATTGSSRRLSVTVNQYEYVNGPAVSVQATRVVTPASDIVNGYVDMGELSLPIKDYDESNDDIYYTLSVHGTDTGDSFQDVLFLDTTGQTVLVNIAPGTAADSRYSAYYIDEPTSDRALGQVLGSDQGRGRAVSVLDMALPTGGPLYLDAGHNLLLAYSTGGAPNLGVQYAPRWYTDRVK